MKKRMVLLMIAGLTMTAGFAQKPMQIIAAYGGPASGTAYIYPKEYQSYIIDYIAQYPNGSLKSYNEGYLAYPNVNDSSHLLIQTQVVTPVNVKYSLYTYKKTFSQDGKRNYYQGAVEAGTVNPITTQAQIDADLDKIYELPIVTETTSGYRELAWDGYTDPQFTGGQKYAVRDAVYIAAYNADTGELIDTNVASTYQNYALGTYPGIEYRIDQQKDDNGKVVKETLSGTIIVAYPDIWPIKKITALIITEDCGYGALTYDVINQGADAIVADINRRLPGDVLAHIALTNPVVDKENPDIKVFDWKDIQTEDGKDFVPDLIKYPNGYILAIIIDMDEMTFTGIKNGGIGGGGYIIPPVPKSYTGINSVNADKSEIKIYPDGSGNFVVDSPNGVSATKYRIFDINGRELETGNVVGGKIKTAAHLNNGNVYIIQVDTDNSTVTRKVVIR